MPIIDDGLDDTEWEHLLGRSSLGTSEGQSLAQRAPRQQLDDLMTRIVNSINERAEESENEQNLFGNDPSTSTRENPAAGVSLRGVGQSVTEFLARLTNDDTDTRADTGVDLLTVMAEHLVAYLQVVVMMTERWCYVSRRPLAWFLTRTGALPAACDSPILSRPRDRGSPCDSDDKRTVSDDVALVSAMSHDQFQTYWPSMLGPNSERFIDALNDTFYEVDLAPHTFMHVIPQLEEAKHESVLFVLFLWRVDQPERFVRSGIDHMSAILSQWWDRWSDLVRANWRGKDGGLNPEVHRSIICHRYWRELGLVVGCDVIEASVSTIADRGGRPPGAQQFLIQALNDRRRWFRGTEHLVKPHVGGVIQRREIERTKEILATTENCRERFSGSLPHGPGPGKGPRPTRRPSCSPTGNDPRRSDNDSHTGPLPMITS